MAHLIDKDALVAEIERRKHKLLDNIIYERDKEWVVRTAHQLNRIILFLDTLEVKDPYEQTIQYSSIEDGIKAHAEDYSFNIESELFNQLTKEQQALWRKEIEQAVISGEYNGLSLAKDPRYKENLEVKEVDLKKEIGFYIETSLTGTNPIYTKGAVSCIIEKTAKDFFELGMAVSNKAQKGEEYEQSYSL